MNYTAGMSTAEQRLFAPGAGATPPALTGREQEQGVLSLCLSDLTRGASPPHNVVLIGPRGNGKTALLRWFERACLAIRPKVSVVMIAAADIPDRDTMLARLAPPTGIAKLLGKVGFAAPPNLTERLIARCRRRPLAVLIDEAHTLDLDVGQVLLNASQQVRSQTSFMLALAGTPGLFSHFRKMNVSHWDRLGSGLLGIGRLSDAAAREALAAPLATRQVSIDVDALETVVEHSQRYPYFVQLWGEALWNQHLATGETRLTAAHVATAQPTVDARTAEYYQRRYRELERSALLPAAVAVASAFRGDMDATATDQDIDAAFATIGMAAEHRLATRNGLERLGYIWCPPGQLPPVVWSPGIPSLMQYVRDCAHPRDSRQ